MKHQPNKNECIKAYQVNQVRIEFTDKVVTSWGGICTLMAKFLEQIKFKKWVEETIPIEERSPNARGVYPKVLAQLLTCLTGGSRFNHLQWWGHGIEAVRECFGEKWLPQASSVLTRFWGKIKYQSPC